MMGNMLYFSITRDIRHYLFLLGGRLGSLPGGQRLLRLGDDGGSAQGGLGQVLPVPLLVEDSLDLVQGPPGAGLHGGGHRGLGGLEHVLRLPGGQHKPVNNHGKTL